MIDRPLDLADPSGRPRALQLNDVIDVARGLRPVEPLREAADAWRPIEQGIAASAAWVASQAARLGEPDVRPIYGINTGLGALAGRATFASAYHARVLQWNLLVSHAAGAGTALPEDAVRAAALVRANQLARGHSGVRIGLINRLIAVLNARLYPQVPEMGSLGASGDLAPLAYLGLAVSRPPIAPTSAESLPLDATTPDIWVAVEGRADADETASCDARPPLDPFGGSPPSPRAWRRATPEDVDAAIGGRMVLEAKEGLALTNGTTFSTALGALALVDALQLLDAAELALAMTFEAIRGVRDAFLPQVHEARGMPGQTAVAARVLRYTAGSTLLDRGDACTEPARVPPQDPYSVRCGPQVLGAARDALGWARTCVEAELNAAVDNPLIFLDLPRAEKAVSGGNFHGAPIGYAMDLLKIVVTDTASQAERRAYLLTDYRFDDAPRRDLSLPLFLVSPGAAPEGLSSGLMIPQYTAASLVSACKTLAHPDSVDSIPSSAGQEDHVSMSMNAARHARAIVAHAEAVVAIELLLAAQAIDLRRNEGAPGAGVAAAHARLRQDVQPLTFDRGLHQDVQRTLSLVRSGALVDAARDATR